MIAAIAGGLGAAPGIYIGAFVSNYVLFDPPVAEAAAIAATNTAGPLIGAALLRRPGFIPYAHRNWHLGLMGGLGTLISYGLVLWSMTMAPVALVAALRETSILFGTIIAVLVLKERVTRTRLIAVLIIAAGAAVLKLA